MARNKKLVRSWKSRNAILPLLEVKEREESNERPRSLKIMRLSLIV